MQSLRSLAIIVAFLFVVFAFTGTAMSMFLSDSSAQGFRLAADMVKSDTTKALIDAAAALRAAAQTTETSHHNYGMQITNALFLLITAAIGANVIGQGVDRFSSREHGESKAKIERAKSEGVESARIAANGNSTKEHQAQQPQPQPAQPQQQTNISIGGENADA